MNDDLKIEREIREAFQLLDPPESHRGQAVAAAWRLAREGAHQRGLFQGPGDKLAALARLDPSPWDTAFTYEQRPAFARMRDILDDTPQPLLPALTEAVEGYLQALAGPIQLLSTPSGRLGVAFLRELQVSPDEVLDFEDAVLEQFQRDASSEGIHEAMLRARFAHGFSERELQQLSAMHVQAQALAFASLDDESLVKIQVVELDRLASRMASGLAPDLRGAAMARREIARLLRGEDDYGEGASTSKLARIAESKGLMLPRRRIPVRAAPSDAE